MTPSPASKPNPRRLEGSGTLVDLMMGVWVKLAVGVLNAICRGKAWLSVASVKGKISVIEKEETPAPNKLTKSTLCPLPKEPKILPFAVTVKGLANPVGKLRILVNSEPGVIIL